MASSLSSRITFYDTAGAIPGPVEGGKCGIAINVPKKLHSAISLKVSGYPLPVNTDKKVAFAEWPPCGPGYYELLLECEDIREMRTVTVMPKYFTETDFSAVIRDLTESFPYSIAAYLKACGAPLGSLPPRDQVESLEDEFLKMRRAIEGTKEQLGMLQILPLLQRNCHQVLVPKLELQSVERARRPDISRLPQAISIPGNLVKSNQLYQMFDVVTEQSYEAYENRLVKAYVVALRSRLSRLQAKLASTVAPPAMAQELAVLTNEFQLACTRALFLREVRSSTVSSIRVNMVLLKKPAYRAVLEGYLALKEQPSVSLEDAAIQNPLTYFPYLYQRWANLLVLNSMLRVCADVGYQCVSHHWVKSYRESIIIKPMNDGRPAVQVRSPGGQLVSFVPWSPSGEISDTPMGAAIFIEHQDRPATLLLFDPKYWIDSESATEPQPLKKDVDELLRVIQKGKDNPSDLQYSAILIPGGRKKLKLGSGLESLPAHPANAASFQKTVCEIMKRHFN